MVYAVMYVSENGGAMTRWRVTYPSRCVAEAKAREFEARGIRAQVVNTDRMRETRNES